MLFYVEIMILIFGLLSLSFLFSTVLNSGVGVQNLIRVLHFHQFLETYLHQLLTFLWFQAEVGAVPLPIETFGYNLWIPCVFGRLVGLFLRQFFFL